MGALNNIIDELTKIRDVKQRRMYLTKHGYSGEELEQILETTHLRVKGREKFPRAAQMLFDREGLSQASSKQVAEYRTWKMRQRLGDINRALDVGSGIGGDTIAMAMRWSVVAVDIDPERMKMLHHNLAVYNLEPNVEAVEGDITVLIDDPEFRAKLNGVDCVFFDPSRRHGSKRTVKLEEYEPAISLIERLREFTPNICVKISPGADLSRVKYDCDIEVVSLRGEVKEVMLWFGGFKTEPDRRVVLATKLPEKVTMRREDNPEKPRVTTPQSFLYEPDPAYIKAHMVDTLAVKYGLNVLHPRIAYLTGERVFSPVLKTYRVLGYTELDYPRVNQMLTENNIGNVDFKARGVNLKLSGMNKVVRGNGRRKGLVVFTLVEGKPSAVLCRYTISV